jgi:hypothetical protein
MATPREGWEEESRQGGSIIITSNSLPPIRSCVSAKSCQSKVRTSPLIGTAFSST